ncbi:MAG: sugar ABC transporter ATP-binding protein [Trueperaceae bacterium]
MNQQPLLEVRNVSKAFAGVQALDNVSLTIMPGEIHCLAGENGSGKSTLIKVVGGVLGPDEGQVVLNGRPFQRLHPIDAIREGIQIIYQDLSLFPNLTVAENLALNHLLTEKRRLVNWREVQRVAREALDRLDVKIPLKAMVESLPVADKQLVAILRALMSNAKLIIMDEPTTALTEKEVKSLLGFIKRLQADGISVLFVSHKLNEVLEVSDNFTVLRNGKGVAAGPASEFDLDSLSFHMTGRKLSAERHASAARTDEPPILKVSNLTKKGHFRNVDLTVHRGEVVGIAGLLGSGRTALAMALFGLTPYSSGEVSLDGQRVRLRDVPDAVAQGMAYVPEDRLTEGLFLSKSVGDNIVVSNLDALKSALGMLETSKLREEAGHWVQELQVVTPSVTVPVQSLSGGNQQRVMLARWLATNPKLLILNGPTVGVDVGSKADIHGIIRELVRRGIGALVISDDLGELLHMCDRLVIMREGRMVEEVTDLSMSEAELAHKVTS